MQARAVCRISLLIAVILAVMFCAKRGAIAAQHEVLRDQDIVMDIDWRWPGCAYGGYFPIRIKMSNLGAPRLLTVTYEGENLGYGQPPRVIKRVRLETQATINFTLSIPMVSEATYGEVNVSDGGYTLAGLTSRQALPEYGGDSIRTSMLVIDSNNLGTTELAPFESAAATESAYLTGTAMSSGHYGGYSPSSTSAVTVVVQPSKNLPVNWIDYSGVDLVFVAWADWKDKLSNAERDAIVKWVETGGVLSIYGTGKPAAELPELHRTLKLSPAEGRQWQACRSDDYRSTNIVNLDASSGSHLPQPEVMTTPENDDEKSEPTGASDRFGWKIAEDTFVHRDLMSGRIYVFPTSPFPGVGSDWCWWLSSVPRNMSQFARKHGFSPRIENPEFLNFLIPGVGSVPVFPFLALITVFAIVIGPLNYFWLRKHRRLAAMVFTVPVIAGVTSALLFIYSMVSDGFSTKSRTQSLTWIDQQRNSAVSYARECLYSPFAPSSGLQFTSECAVFPIRQMGTQFERGTVDWSANDQRMTSGWLRSQTWTQFMTVDHRDERGRVDYKAPTDPASPSLEASNGLTWDLKYLAINTGSGEWYAGENVPAGATATLKKEAASDVTRYFRVVNDQNGWVLPPGVNVDFSTRSYNWRRPYRYYATLPTTLTQAPVVKLLPIQPGIDDVPRWDLLDWRDGRNFGQTQPHSTSQRPRYWAIARSNPGVQIGLKNTTTSQDMHIIYGTF